MARIRSIKPEFWTSEQIMDCSPLARLLFIGMWNFADDYGRLPVAVRTLKAQIMPGDSIETDEVRELIGELSAAGLIFIYSSNGREYLEITGWEKHQKIDNKGKPKYPSPYDDNAVIDEPSPSLDSPSEESGKIGLEGKGEGEGVEKENNGAGAPDDWPKDFREVFWQAYPRRVGQQGAIRELERVRKRGVVEFQKLIAAVKAYAACADPNFTKHPKTWLTNGCWDDELSRPSAAPGSAAKISPASPSWNPWRAYFRDHNMNARVQMMDKCADEGREFTVESEWPPGQRAA